MIVPIDLKHQQYHSGHALVDCTRRWRNARWPLSKDCAKLESNPASVLEKAGRFGSVLHGVCDGLCPLFVLPLQTTRYFIKAHEIGNTSPRVAPIQSPPSISAPKSYHILFEPIQVRKPVSTTCVCLFLCRKLIPL